MRARLHCFSQAAAIDGKCDLIHNSRSMRPCLSVGARKRRGLLAAGGQIADVMLRQQCEHGVLVKIAFAFYQLLRIRDDDGFSVRGTDHGAEAAAFGIVKIAPSAEANSPALRQTL